MTTVIDWRETRACIRCKQRMILTHVLNSESVTQFEESKAEWLRDARDVMRCRSATIVKMFGCPKCGLRMTDTGALP